MSEELKPCRRCGTKITIEYIRCKKYKHGAFGAMLYCPTCCEDAVTDRLDMTREEAIEEVKKIWNERHVDPVLIARIAELEAARDHFREVAEKLVWLYSDEHQGRLDNGLRIDGFYSHEWLGMILDMAREALKGEGE